jgi:hypothetical protein
MRSFTTLFFGSYSSPGLFLALAVASCRCFIALLRYRVTRVCTLEVFSSFAAAKLAGNEILPFRQCNLQINHEREKRQFFQYSQKKQ